MFGFHGVKIVNNIIFFPIKLKRNLFFSEPCLRPESQIPESHHLAVLLKAHNSKLILRQLLKDLCKKRTEIRSSSSIIRKLYSLAI